MDYRLAPATETLVELRDSGYAEKIDLCFIDADKVDSHILPFLFNIKVKVISDKDNMLRLHKRC